MLFNPAAPTSGVKTPEFSGLFGTPEEAAERHRKAFLRGLKPIGYKSFTPELKPRPPKEQAFPASCEAVPLKKRPWEVI